MRRRRSDLRWPLHDRLLTRSRAALYRAGDRVAGVQCNLPSSRPGVALTFDDGPDPVYTPQVLEILAEHGATATFFVVGRRVRRHPEIVAQMVAAGHAVGSHSETHPDPSLVSPRRLLADYRSGRVTLQRALGQDTRLFRPPMGHVGLTGAGVIRRAGLRPWLWTINPLDWSSGTTPDAIVRAANDAVGGDVILLHDGLEQPVEVAALDRRATVAALPFILDRLRRHGLTTLRLA